MQAFLSCMCLVVEYLIIIVLILSFVKKITTGLCKSNTCLIGKTVLITGGNAGLGFETARILAGRGARVIIADRDDATASIKKIVTETKNENIVYKYVDLSSFSTIRHFAKEINAEESRLDILINNAGSTGFQDKLSKDGLPLGIQVNYLGAFLLTHLLIDLMKASAPSRILFVSSALAFVNNVSVGNMDRVPRTESSALREILIYSNTKVMNIIAANIFAEKLRGHGITSNSIHPGLVDTSIFSKLPSEFTSSFKFTFFNKVILKLFGKTPWEGVQTTVDCATSQSIQHVTGKFFADCTTIWQPWKANDRDLCMKLWEKSEDLVKLSPEEKLQ